MNAHTNANRVNSSENRVEEYCQIRERIDEAKRLLELAENNAERGYYDVAWDCLLDVSVLTDQYRTVFTKSSEDI